MNAAAQHAAVYSGVAAVLWATYYFLVLAAAPSSSLAELLVLPFAVGAVAYYGIAAARGAGREFARASILPGSVGRGALYAGTQVTILVVTLSAGPIDAAILSLVGDVALTPLVAGWVLREGRDRWRHVPFVAGLVLAGGGGTLTILSGGSAAPLTGSALIVGPLVPVTVAAFFVWTAHAGRTRPIDAVAGSAALWGGILLAVGSVLLGGTVGALAIPPSVPFLELALTGVTSFAIAPALYFAAIRRVGFLLPSLLMAGIPVSTLALQALLLRTVPPTLGIVGIGIAVAGAVLAVARWEDGAPASPPPRER